MKKLLLGASLALSVMPIAHADIILTAGNRDIGIILLLNERTAWCDKWSQIRGHQDGMAGVLTPPGFNAKSPDAYVFNICWTIDRDDFLVETVNVKNGIPYPHTASSLSPWVFDEHPGVGRDYWVASDRYPLNWGR